MARIALPRRVALAEIRARFVEKGYPRATVLVFVIVSGLAAFGCSTALLGFGVEHMGYRYLASTAVGYAMFLLLIRAWIEVHRPRDRRRDIDVPDLAIADSPGAGADVEFSGGSSGGGGASGSCQGADVPGIDVDLGVADADEAWPVVVVIAVAAVVLLGGVVALFYVIYYAPVLLAEIALDAALVTGIYRKLRKEDARYWLDSALRHTWVPAAIAALCL